MPQHLNEGASSVLTPESSPLHASTSQHSFSQAGGCDGSIPGVGLPGALHWALFVGCCGSRVKGDLKPRAALPAGDGSENDFFLCLDDDDDDDVIITLSDNY